MAAVNLPNCDEVPVLGKVLEATADRVKVHYWKGSFKGKWSPHNVPRTRTAWVDDLSKECIILSSFSLTEGNKLFPSTRKHVQDECKRLGKIYVTSFLQHRILFSVLFLFHFMNIKAWFVRKKISCKVQ